MRMRSGFIRICFYIGAAADALAVVPLGFPGVAQWMFGLPGLAAAGDYVYASRIGASLMLGWTVLLFWASLKPLHRRGVLLITVFPVIAGLFISSVLAVKHGFIETRYMIPLWIFYVLIIPMYISAYVLAGTLLKGRKRDE